MSQVFLLLTLLTLSSSLQVSPARQFKITVERWSMYHSECLHNISTQPSFPGVVCNRTFDRYACWPDGQPNTTVSVACPWYLPWYSDVKHGFVYRDCGPDGQWLSDRNASECELTDQHGAERHGRILSMFRAMYTVGYSLSLGALVLALGILIAFRKLHCTRNNIHMNLFASFILRAMSILIKDVLIAGPLLNIDQDININNNNQVDLLVNNQTVIGCRVAVVMMQYSITANSYWLLVEGIYLHNLLVVTVLTERNYFGVYLCIGWGIPLMFVFPWVIVKYLYENEGCWEQNTNMGYWWIIRLPILLSVLMNFFIFIRIIKILVSKLRAHQMRYTDYKFRLAKSTLTLIPLLGIHLVLFSLMIDESTSGRAPGLRLTKLFIDLLFSSFQGLLVAILYCFVNKEVQSEILKRWKRWKLGRNIEEEYRHTYSHTVHMRGGSLVTQPSLLPHSFPDVASVPDAPTLSPQGTTAIDGSCGGITSFSRSHKEKEEEEEGNEEEKCALVACQNGLVGGVLMMEGGEVFPSQPSPSSAPPLLLSLGSPKDCGQKSVQGDVLLVDQGLQGPPNQEPVGSRESNL